MENEWMHVITYTSFLEILYCFSLFVTIFFFYKPKAHARNLNKEICIKLEITFDYRRYHFLDLLFSSYYNASVRKLTDSLLLSICTVCSDRKPTAGAIWNTTSLARRYGISSFATHGPLSATVFMVLYLNLSCDMYLQSFCAFKMCIIVHILS